MLSRFVLLCFSNTVPQVKLKLWLDIFDVLKKPKPISTIWEHKTALSTTVLLITKLDRVVHNHPIGQSKSYKVQVEIENSPETS